MSNEATPESDSDEQFKRIAWQIATSTALETCESPQEIYRRLMVRRQEEQNTNQTAQNHGH